MIIAVYHQYHGEVYPLLVKAKNTEIAYTKVWKQHSSCTGNWSYEKPFLQKACQDSFHYSLFQYF